MRNRIFMAAAVAAVVVGSAGTALAASGNTSTVYSGCVVGSSRALQNVHETPSTTCAKGFEIAWNKVGQQGPAGPQGAPGAQGPAGPQGPTGVVGTTTTDLGSVASVPTGGSFVTNATEVGAGKITLKAGTYLLSLNAKATPNVSSGTEVFPQFFVYDEAANASFTGDLFNVGSGSLALNNTNIDSYFSGSTVITLAHDTTLHVYAFGYDGDRGAGSYTLDDLSVSATQIHPGS